MLDLMKMMGKLKEVQARMKEAQNDLLLLKVTGESGGGMVKVTVNGKRQLIAVEIDPTILKSEDQIIVQDLVVAAVNKALDEAEVKANEHLRKSTEGMIPNIPGMDLNNFMA